MGSEYNKRVRVNVSLSQGILAGVDRRLEESRLNRSDLIEQLLLQWCNQANLDPNDGRIYRRPVKVKEVAS